MSSCSFCGSAIEQGTGKMFIKKDGSVFHFCSSKCEHNQVDLGRINRHVRWTQAAAHAKATVGHAGKSGEDKAAKPKAAKAAAPAKPAAAKPAAPKAK